jgi:hypothetical protein
LSDHGNKDGKYRKYGKETERHDHCVNDIDIKKKSSINRIVQTGPMMKTRGRLFEVQAAPQNSKFLKKEHDPFKLQILAK